MEIITFLLTTSFACIVVYIYTIWKTLKIFEHSGIPYVPGLPILGNIGPSLFQKIQVGQLVQKFYNQFSDAKYFGMFDCNLPVIVIKDPELIKQITIKNFEHFTDHHGFSTKVDKIFDGSLFTLKGDRWKEMRGLISPVFTSSKIKQMFEIISECAKSFSRNIEDNLEKGITQFDIKEVTGRYTNDIICKYAFGINVDSVKNPQNEIYKTGKQLFTFTGPLSLRFFLLNKFPLITNLFNITLFDKKGTDFFSMVIKNTIIERDKFKIDNVDMLQIMVDASRNSNSKVKVDIDDILCQTFSFYFGGYDTISSQISYILYLLATHQDVQERLMAEIDEIYEKTNGDLSYETIYDMNYMECVIHEAGRMYPPLPYINRMCTKTFKLPPSMPGYESVTLTPGTVVYIPCYALHYDSQYFPNPEKFDPDRFLNKKINNESGYFMPFGLGRRACIGSRFAIFNIKLLLFNLLLRFSFKLGNKTVTPMKLATNSFFIVFQDKLWLEIIKRNKHKY